MPRTSIFSQMVQLLLYSTDVMASPRIDKVCVR